MAQVRGPQVALMALAVVAALNGLDLGGANSSWTLARQLAYLPILALAWWLGRTRDVSGWGVAALVAVLVGLSVGLWFIGGAGWAATVVVYAGLAVVTPWSIAQALRRRALLAEALRGEIEQAQQTREAYAELARVTAGAELARDMHDLLGHDLALIALQAGRLELAAAPSVRAEAAQVRQLALDATDRLRGYLSADHTAPAAATSVAEVVARARRSGLDVTLTGDSTRPLLIRAAVEGIANAVRHAPGAAVRVAAAPDRLTMVNPLPTTRPDSSPGSGLAGLREAVEAEGGTLALTDHDGHWTVRVTMPT